MPSAFAPSASFAAPSNQRWSRWVTRVFSSRVANDVAFDTQFSAPDLADIGFDPRPTRAGDGWNAPSHWSA